MAEDDKARLRKSQLKSSQGASLKDLPNIEQLQRDASAHQMSTPDRSPPKQRSASPSQPDRTDHPASPVLLHRERDDTRSPSPSVTHHHHHKDKSEKKDKEHHHRGKSPGLGDDLSRSATAIPTVTGAPNLSVTKSTGALPDRPKTPPGEVKPHVSRPPPTDEDDHAGPTQALASPTTRPVNTLKHSMDSHLAAKPGAYPEAGPEDFKKVKLLGKGDVGKVYLVQNKVSHSAYLSYPTHRGPVNTSP
jgi:hypothetical protein